MKKIIVSLSMLLVLIGCGGNSETSSTKVIATVDYGALPMPKNAEFILKTTHSLSPDIANPAHAALIYFKQYLETISGGRIGVEIYPLASLGSGVDILPQLENGTIAMNFEATRVFSGFFPELQVLDIPFLIPEPTEIMSHYLTESRELAKLFNSKVKTRFPNITVEGISLFGFRQMSATKPINSYADLKGLKMRTTGAAIHEEFYKKLGMIPITVPWQENYTALSTGISEGLHNPLSDIVGNQLEDYLKYIYLDNSLLHGAVWMISDKALAELPKDLQKQVILATDMARQYWKMVIYGSEYRNIGEMQAKGIVIKTVTEEDKLLQKQINKEITAWFLNKYGAEAKKTYDQVLVILSNTQQEIKDIEDLKFLQ